VCKNIVRILDYFKERWFLFAVVAVCAITLLDVNEQVAALGKWCKAKGGADAVIFLIFLASGLILNNEQIRKGIGEEGGATVIEKGRMMMQIALAFCVIHHFVHLMMDGYLVHRLGR
jgi:hypothetical protein